MTDEAATIRIGQGDCDTIPLAVAPHPLAGEHISGYLRRLARANDLSSLRQLYDIIGTNGFSQTGGNAQWNALASATGLHASAFDGLRLPALSSSSGALVAIGGMMVRANQISAQCLSFCPLCLAESDFVPNLWSVHLITACRRHDVQLIDCCSSCGKTLRLDTVNLGWNCRSCGHPLEQMGTRAASDPERIMASSLEDAKANPAAGALPPAFAALSADTKLAVVERLGAIVARAADDAPLRKKRTLASGKVDAVKSNRRTEDSRLIVKQGIEILHEWPRAFHALMNSLLDRAPYSGHQLPALRRMATEAGCLAMRHLYSSEGHPVEFIETERTRWLERTFASHWGARRTRQSTAQMKGVDEFSIRADQDTSAYMNAAEALKVLGGGKSIGELTAWVRAELLEIHRNTKGYLIPRASVANVVRMISTLPRDDGRKGLTDAVDLNRSHNPAYDREDLLIDIAIGHIGAFVRYPRNTGLAALALSVQDLMRRRDAAILAALATEDAFRRIATVDHYFKAVWGDPAPVNAGQLAAATAHGHLRNILPSGTNSQHSIRDLIVDFQGRLGLERVFNVNAFCNGGGRRPRDAITQMPRYEGIPELTSYASNYVRF